MHATAITIRMGEDPVQRWLFAMRIGGLRALRLPPLRRKGRRFRRALTHAICLAPHPARCRTSAVLRQGAYADRRGADPARGENLFRTLGVPLVEVTAPPNRLA